MSQQFWLKLLLTLFCLTPVAWAETVEEESEVALRRALEAEIRTAIATGEMAGATLLVGRNSEVLIHEAFGLADQTKAETLTTEHLFDAASLTKPLVTAVSVLLLAQEGRLDLDAPLSDYLPTTQEPSPTLRQLLTHHSGLPAVIEAEGLPRTLLDVSLQNPPGSRFLYSDVGFLMLQQVVEAESGQTLDEFYQARVAVPLALERARFRPLGLPCVPTYGVRPGEVHDPRANSLGGVAGHAGLFITALDVHQELAGLSRILEPEFRKLLFRPAEGGRTLGLDQDTAYSSARGWRFSPLTSAGHTGFTGTSFWWDEPTGLHVILMTSRLHPDNKGQVIPLRRRVATLVAEHYLGKVVHTGLDRLLNDGFKVLSGKRVGLVVNQTSRDRFGRHLTELVGSYPDVEVGALFTPEHGLLGVRDEKIEHGFHRELAVPVYSLYGETRKPKPEWFEGLDVVVFDLQDVGVRYYTYISTLKAVLEVAEEVGVEVLVLDRPNPLGGTVVDGHRAEVFSFIACDSLPVVHGLTMAEVGRFLNREIGAKLSVVPLEGWSRDMRWPETGLSLFSPSPNLAEFEAIELYPLIGQLEWCHLSVGRGTRSPFRVIGAPYIRDPGSLASLIRESFGKWLMVRPRFFVPQESVFAGELCGGVELRTRGVLERPAQLGLGLAELLERSYPGEFHRDKMNRHLGLEGVRELSTPNLEEWRNVRRGYLLYEERE